MIRVDYYGQPNDFDRGWSSPCQNHSAGHSQSLIMGYIKCSSVQGTPILVYLPYLPFLVNEHFIFIDIQTILPNIVNIELREFLAPPAERQRSFSNTDLSVVRLSVRPSVRPSVKIEGGRGLSQKRFSNFSSFLA